MTPLDETPVVTPLGVATLFGVNSNVANPVWACWIDSTQELWWFGNPHVRRRPTVTDSPHTQRISGFTHINTKLYSQIARYVQHGWLPENYDPADPRTWQL